LRRQNITKINKTRIKHISTLKEKMGTPRVTIKDHSQPITGGLEEEEGGCKMKDRR